MIYVPSISLIATLPAANTDGNEASITPTLDYLQPRKDEEVEREKGREAKESSRGKR